MCVCVRERERVRKTNVLMNGPSCSVTVGGGGWSKYDYCTSVTINQSVTESTWEKKYE